MQLRHIDFSKNSFEANGTTYYIREAMTLTRFIEYEKIQNHYAFGLNFAGIVGRLNKSIDLANAGKGVDAWNVIYNLKEGIASRLEDRLHPAFLLCSLFIVTDDEDLTVWTEEGQKKKIEDWTRAGIDANDFFQLASNFVGDFVKSYSEISQSISELVGQRHKK